MSANLQRNQSLLVFLAGLTTGLISLKLIRIQGAVQSERMAIERQQKREAVKAHWRGKLKDIRDGE